MLEAPEVWISPNGTATTLHNVVLPALPDEDGWFADDPGQGRPVAYELRAADGYVVDSLVVTPYAPWSPYDTVSDALVRDGWTPPAPTDAEDAECEHGMSARLCSGSAHY